MMLDVQLKVTPEELKVKAEQVNGHLSALRQRFQSMEQSVNRSASYWQGEAGDMHRRDYQERKEGIGEIFRRLSEQVSDLQAIAANYQESERQVSEFLGDLPSDVIL